MTLSADDWARELAVKANNADVVQIVNCPKEPTCRSAPPAPAGWWAQVVQRFNVPAVEPPAVEMFRIDVEYSADHVAVDDLIEVTARFAFTPPESPEPARTPAWSCWTWRSPRVLRP